MFWMGVSRHVHAHTHRSIKYGLLKYTGFICQFFLVKHLLTGQEIYSLINRLFSLLEGVKNSFVTMVIED